MKTGFSSVFWITTLETSGQSDVEPSPMLFLPKVLFASEGPTFHASKARSPRYERLPRVSLTGRV